MLNELKNVTVSVKGNIYFEGKVTSRTILLNDNSKVTLGIILPGEYEFPVSDKENVTITSGSAWVLLPNEVEWKKINMDETFTVISNSNYKIKCDEIVEYYCLYIVKKKSNNK